MRLRRLALSCVRNYAALDLEPANGINVFVGPNAQGKSNLLEAIAMLGTGKSFRTNRDADIVRDGVELAVVRGEAEVRAGMINLACAIAKGVRGTRKTYTINGRDVRYARFLGKVRVVTFVPADLQLVGGAPNGRRAFLNGALAQEEPGYFRALARYRRAVEQKNALLRRAETLDRDILAIYDQVLVEAGTEIVLARNHFTAALAAEAQKAHARFTGNAERLEVTYEPNVAFEAGTADAIGAALAARLRQIAPAEAARKTALAGPHRDDLGLRLRGASLAAFASQGQQRTAVLALKVAEYAVMRERAGEAPLLLLDDVLSELDPERAAAFLTGIGEYEQAFVTATHLPGALPARTTLFAVHNAQVEPAPC